MYNNYYVQTFDGADANIKLINLLLRERNLCTCVWGWVYVYMFFLPRFLIGDGGGASVAAGESGKNPTWVHINIDGSVQTCQLYVYTVSITHHLVMLTTFTLLCSCRLATLWCASLFKVSLLHLIIHVLYSVHGVFCLYC